MGCKKMYREKQYNLKTERISSKNLNALISILVFLSGLMEDWFKKLIGCSDFWERLGWQMLVMIGRLYSRHYQERIQLTPDNSNPR